MNNLDNDHLPPFELTLEQLEQILGAPNNGLLSFRELLDGLQTSIASGIAGDEVDIRRRRRAFGTNNVVVEHQPPSICTFHELVSESLRNSTFVLLLCCAALSVAIGVRRNGAKQGFLDGVVFFLAIFLSLHFGAVFKVVKAKCMIKKRRKMVLVKVIRHGQKLQIPPSEVVVGEVVFLEGGDEVPADGIFITRGGAVVNTAVFTGENPAEEGLIVVTAVGKNTEREKLLRQSRKHQNPQSKCSKFECEIENISVVLQRIWLCLSLLVLSVQAVRCFLKKSWCEENPSPGKGVKNTVEEMMNETTRILDKFGVGGSVNNSGRLVSKLCVLLFALGDGLPLGIFITLSYASKKMNKYYGATAGKLPACATIGSVTTICATKTGDLSLDPTSMADLWIGFKKIKNPTSGEVDNCVLDKLRQGIWSFCEDEDSLVLWAENVVGRPMNDLVEENWKPLTRNGENLRGMMVERKKEGVIIRIQHWKGDAKLILSMCSHYHGVDGAMQPLDDQQKTHFFNQIPKTSSSHTLRLVAFAYKQLKLQQTDQEDDGENNINDLMEEKNGLVLIGIVALRNPYGVELRNAIESCRKSGVKLKLVVEDNIKTSRIMAFHSGIKGAVVKASDFRTLQDNVIDESCVFADFSPADQLLLIQRLRQNGEVVLSTAISVRHLPSLQESDVGIFMGESLNLQDSADITIQGSLKFGTIFEILMFGRHICRNLQIFTQLQLTLNVTAFAVTFIAQISNPTAKEPLTAFQILWVSLVMDTLGAYFLAKSTLENPNYPRILQGTHLAAVVNTITKINVAIQSLFQVTVLLTLNCLNKGILIFHCYALLQVFVLIAKITAADTGKSRRRLMFLAFSVLLMFVSLQVAMSEFMAAIFHWQKLGFKQWLICVGISFLSVPIAYAANFISAMV
ncbi:calcium-transporting ATPase 7, plasma membrane-type-like [Ipomoea triloba]|uniref:calcium-transporting ATPase 7, plasma membrane-type-like n=1 Tax=Ipomoea triloba TaxID=35885 RepID=UPI00125CE608|nr:calcium-transporting ATPase 7, plasma membrane-type-like [Ipomoea triloba]